MILGACDFPGSDPYRGVVLPACIAGHARTSDDTWCALPVLMDPSSGSELPLTAECLAPPCAGLVPQGITAIEYDDDNTIAIRLRTDGALPADAGVDLRLELASITSLDSGDEVDALVAGSPVSWWKNGVNVTTFDHFGFAFQWRADGYDLIADARWLPPDGAADVTIRAERGGGPITSDVHLRLCWARAPLPDHADPCVEGSP
jgi:hypothetical protein